MDTFSLAALLNGGCVSSDTSLPIVHPALIPVRTFQRPNYESTPGASPVTSGDDRMSSVSSVRYLTS